MKIQTESIIRAIRKMPTKQYLAYIRSPQWKQKREEHLDRCDRWCEICHKARACQVHHVTYARLGWEQPQDLTAVCVNCHHKIHCSVLEPANDNQPPLPGILTG